MNKSILLLSTLVSTMLLASTQVDGDLSDWNSTERINFPKNLPRTLATTPKLFAHYDSNKYYFALESDIDTPISSNTTFWLNSDQNKESGFKIWGAYLGAEFYVNIAADNQPYLYKTEPFGEFVAGPLEYAYNGDNTILEFAIDATLLNNPSSGIDVLADINDNTFIPSNYANGDLHVNNVVTPLPVRTDFTKRVGIVYSKSSKELFYDINSPIQKSYSQLYMAVQHQCMMAGIPFVLLNEDDLTDVSNIVNLDALIIPSFEYAPKDKFSAIMSTLNHAVYDYKIGIISAGDMLTSYATGETLEGDVYRNMKQLLGLGRVDGDGPVSLTLRASDISHSAMKGYSANEAIYTYDDNRWYSYFAPVSSGSQTQDINVLATQEVNGDYAGNYNAVIADTTGGRNVHFSSISLMGDTNLLWSALQWSVYGDNKKASLKMGRYNNLFVSRNDMDQSQEIDEVKDVDGKLLNFLTAWKKNYNFVGSYYINIGNNAPDQRTDWSYSAPLYRKYIDLGSEIGTHSYTHPANTNLLTPEQIEFEFNQSMNMISTELNPTWRNKNIRGSAVPGAPEGTSTAKEIIQHLDYLSGGYSGVGAGYPSAFGYLTPESSKVYFSPSMAFDFTMIDFGVPEFDNNTQQWYPVQLTAAEAELYWKNQYNILMKHASQPIIHWPWHDYGPTSGVKNTPNPYTVAMFENTIKLAKNDNAEFLTTIDAVERIEAFNKSTIEISSTANSITAKVNSANAGKFALDLQLNAGEKIQKVDNWYAYNDSKIFLDKDAGTYTATISTKSDRVTHIEKLPMRAELLSLVGNGSKLDFTFIGEGVVRIKLKDKYSRYTYKGDAKVKKIDKYTAELTFSKYGTHKNSVKLNWFYSIFSR